MQARRCSKRSRRSATSTFAAFMASDQASALTASGRHRSDVRRHRESLPTVGKRARAQEYSRRLQPAAVATTADCAVGALCALRGSEEHEHLQILAHVDEAMLHVLSDGHN